MAYVYEVKDRKKLVLWFKSAKFSLVEFQKKDLNDEHREGLKN